MKHEQDVCVCAQDRDAGEGDAQWELSRFTPLMQEVLEDLAANKLNFDEYPYVQPPTSETGTDPTQAIQIHPTMINFDSNQRRCPCCL